MSCCKLARTLELVHHEIRRTKSLQPGLARNQLAWDTELNEAAIPTGVVPEWIGQRARAVAPEFVLDQFGRKATALTHAR